jgi:hypothetical protein
MTPELKARWIEALESGEYAKGEGAMKYGPPDGIKWCCLGVLCDLLDPDAWVASTGERAIGHKIQLARQFDHIYVHREGAYGMLPMEYRDVLSVPVQTKLSLLNDTSDDFAPVVAYIRDNL